MLRLIAILLLAVASTAAADEAPLQVLSRELQPLAAEARFGEEAAVIISFADRLDPRQFEVFTNAHERRHRLVSALKTQSQDGMRSAITAYLRTRGARGIKPLWLSNSIAATVPAGLLAELAQWPIVARVRVDAVVRAPTVSYDADTPAEWNIQTVRAPDLWGLGYYGQGVTVAILDTGVDLAHPDLRQQYRGGTNSWFDPYGEHATPYDAAGHGTATAGLVLGRNGSGYAIGVAPDAQWIAAKIFDDNGLATLSAIHQAFQWLLDPDGNPATNDVPDLVNSSWGLSGASACTNEFERDIQALEAAGIGVVFSAGNDGPGTSSTVSPGNNRGVLSVGAVDANDAVAIFSSRGPSGCDGEHDPELAAPGVSVFSSDTSFGLGNGAYAYVTGTSFAAPQVTGVMALLLSARSTITIGELKTIVQETARDLGTPGVDDETGHGMVDAFAALGRVLTGDAPVAVRDSVTTAEDTPVTIDVLANDFDPKNNAVSLVGVSSPSERGGTVQANADGTVTYRPPANFFGTDSFGYTISNGLLTSAGLVIVTVTPLNDVPVAADDTLAPNADPANGTYTVASPGVLANDSDADGDALTATLVTNVAAGSVRLLAGGGFTYTPPPGSVPSGTLSFTYRASDGLATSNIATVVFSLNRPPVARDDTFEFTSQPAGSRYRVAAPGVLANDVDADGDPIGVSLVTNTAQGVAELEADGGFVWTPPAGVVPRGVFSFTYQASDGKSLSSVATVTFTVNRAPVANDDGQLVLNATGSGSYMLAAPGVLANDSDPDGDAVAATLVSGASVGTINLAESGAVTYTLPSQGAAPRSFEFTYRATDRIASSNVATARVTLNHTPQAGDDRGMQVTDTGDGWLYASVGGVLINDSDPDGDALTPILIANVTAGSVTLTANGAFVYTAPPEGPPPEPLSFTYQASDGHMVSNTATVTFSVLTASSGSAPVPAGTDWSAPGSSSYSGSWSPVTTPSNFSSDSSWSSSWSSSSNTTIEQASPTESDPGSEQVVTQAPAKPKATRVEEPTRQDEEERLSANDDALSLDEPDAKGRYAIEAPGVLANDRGERITAVLVQNVRVGTVALAPNGGFVYMPPAGGLPAGEISFTYRVQQGNLVSAVATVNIAPRRPLVALPDTFTLAARNARGEYQLEAPGVLANDSGPGAITAVLVQDTIAGSVKLAPNGGFTYAPPPGGAPRAPLSFTYKAVSGTLTSRSATVVFGLKSPLAANADTFALAAVDTQGRYVLPPPGVLANDSGDGALTATLVRNTEHGSVTLAPGGGFTYSPPQDGPPRGALTFSYKLSDAKGGSKEATVTFTLRPRPAKPTAPATAAVSR
jgi:subtilisin family serine protease